jgi:hypothetical protein
MKKYYLHIIVVIGYFLFVAGSCGEEPEIGGCTDLSACNYNIEANVNNDTCIFSQENFDCNGNCITQTDDGCECAVLYDACVFCGGDNSSCTDCAGIPNGNSDMDMCGICDLVVENDCVQDCQGNWGGDAINDVCDICDGGVQDVSNCIECPNSDPVDCIGVCGGQAIEDECGVCDGNNSTCKDCANIPNGDSVVNNCAECVSAGDLTCVQGCDGFWINDGSEVLIDDCGICNGDNSPNTGNCDCNGIVYPIDNYWRIQFILSNLPIVPEGNPPIDTVYDVENYLGGSQDASDNYDSEFDVIEPPHQGNYVSFYFPHEEWDSEWGNNFTQDIRSNYISEYYYPGKTWQGVIVSNITGFATLSVSSFSNILGVDILVSIDGSEFIQLNLNENTGLKPLVANQPQEVIIQISNLCY